MYVCTKLLTKTTAVRNEAAASYHKVHRLYFLAVFFAATIAAAAQVDKNAR